jgi:arsenate reductase
MAEGFFRHFGGDKIDICSAGLNPKGVHPTAIKVMAEVGIDISGHTSNNLNEYLGSQFDLLITVCDNAAANCPVFPGEGQRLHWPFDDPAEAAGSEEQVLDEFRRVRDEIGRKVREFIAAV